MLTPDILIRQDYFWSLITPARKSRDLLTLPSVLCLIPSFLGFLFERSALTLRKTPQDRGSAQSVVVAANAVQVERNSMFPTIGTENFWSLEVMGIMESPTDSDKKVALQKFQRDIHMEDGRYQTT